LMYLGATALYLALMIFVVRWAWRRGRRSNSRLIASVFALLGFLAIYLPAFWNLIPVVIAYRHMCEKDAGFKPLVPPEEWATSNKDRLATVGMADLDATSKSRLLSSGFTRYEFFGGLLARESRSEKTLLYGIDFVRTEDRLVDTQADKTLASRVNYSVGSWEDARIWLTRRSCFKPDNAALDQEQRFLLTLKGRTK